MNAVRDIDILKTWLLSDSLNFTRYFFKSRYHRKFVVGQHHRMIADALNKVYTGETKKLIINIAPRYGKTEQAVKNFIANGLALNPKAKFIHLSYSDDLARDNSRGVQEIMRDPEFQRLFDAKPTSPNTKKWFTRQGGGLYAVSSAGQVTGFGAGLVDEVKNAESDKDLNEALDEFMPEVGCTDFGGAIIFVLTNGDPDHWKNRQNAELTGANGEPLVKPARILTKKEAKEFMKQLEDEV